MAKKPTEDNIQEAINYLARTNFWAFCKYIDPAFFNKDKPHLKLIAEKFQNVADGKIKKLAVSLPPRAGKSYITSMFCGWMLGREPMGSIMRNSYSATLAEKFSKDIRDGILNNPRYKKVFPQAVLSKNNRAVDSWSIEGNTQPSYFCAGVGGSITGFGCRSLAILDDPLKNIEEALSETVIEGVWNWYTSTHLSRLETGCPEIHIATRWSKRDPIGRLTDPDSEYYVPDMEVVCISALDEHGNSFCESIKTTAEYHEIRRITDTFIWEAEFMQNPVEEKGLLYSPAELKRFSMEEIKTKTPDGVVGFTDTADLGSDFLCSIIGHRYGDYTYITDVVFTQDGVEITEPLVADLIIRSKCQVMKVESNNGGRQFMRNVKKLVEGKSRCSITGEMQTKNKETRILMQAGYVKEHFYFRNDYQPGSDYDKFFRQFTGFVKLGRNTHDDACFEAGTMIKTLFGDKPIEKIRIGDMVFTPFGIRKVLACGLTGYKQTINKYGLRATPSHKIFMNGEFVQIKDVDEPICVFNFKEAIRWKYQRLLSLMASRSDLWGRESIILASQQPILGGKVLKDFMLRFGNFIAEKQFQKAITFTTKTATRLTTTLATWSVYLLSNTLKRILESLTKKPRRTLNPLENLQRNGIIAQRERRGTLNTQGKWQQTEKTCDSTGCVLSAEANLYQSVQSRCFVLTDAEKDTETELDTGTLLEKPVYNLCVDKDHVYIANDVLVSNCDAVTGLAEYIPFRHFEKPQEQKRYNFAFEVPKTGSNYLCGEITKDYLDFMGGSGW